MGLSRGERYLARPNLKGTAWFDGHFSDDNLPIPDEDHPKVLADNNSVPTDVVHLLQEYVCEGWTLQDLIRTYRQEVRKLKKPAHKLHEAEVVAVVTQALLNRECPEPKSKEKKSKPNYEEIADRLRELGFPRRGS